MKINPESEKIKTMRTGLKTGLLSLLAAMLLFSCYYDNEEYLYSGGGGPAGCDTTNVTYSNTVATLLANNCNGCHNSGFASAGIITSNHNDLMAIVNDGSFWGSINHQSGYSPMPKNGSKLSGCNLLKIRKWLDDGALNN
jgi:hypothetical protein